MSDETYPREFLADLAALKRLEGGYSNHRDDPGGRTYAGITERDHSDLWRDGQPSDAAVAGRYYRDYWRGAGCWRIASDLVRFELFECGVLCGPRRAGRCLQAAYNWLCEYRGFRPLQVDGAVGPMTAFAVRRWCGISRNYELALARWQNVEQAKLFERIEGAAFRVGWAAQRLGLANGLE